MAPKESRVHTSVLWQRLFAAPSPERYAQENEKELGMPSFSEYITALCKARGEVPERVIGRSGLERSFGHQIFRGVRRPSRDTVLQLAFGVEADRETAQALLNHGRHSMLYPRVKRDAAIGYCLEHGLSFVEAQMVLMEMGLPLMGGGKGR